MTNRSRKSNATSAPHPIKKTIRLIGSFLILLGKPLYLILAFAFLAFIFTANYFWKVGIKTIYICNKILTNVFRFSKKSIKKFKYSFSFPRIRKTLAPSGVIFEVTTGRIKLNVERLLKAFLKTSHFLWFLAKAFYRSLLRVSSFFIRVLLFLIDHLRRKFALATLRIKLSVLSSIQVTKKGKGHQISKLKILAYIFSFAFIAGSIATILFWYFILKDLPSPQILTQRQIPVSTNIYDRNGVLLYTIFKDQDRTPVTLSEVPKEVRLATIAAEDAQFYTHPGFSIKGILRSVIRNFQTGDLTGGSTITQQLIKNTLLTPEKTLKRKIKEIVLALRVELTFTKDEILEMYLNEVSYGGTAYGIQQAARTYFDKRLTDLTLAESAFLAGLPKKPTHLSPFGANPESGLIRQKEVLRLMREGGFITKNQEEEAYLQELTFSNARIQIKAPHFVFYAREQLEEKYGKEYIESGGLNVTTTLDYKIQEFAEEVVREEVEKLKSLNVTNAAVVILNPQTGEILAMVGSYDYFDTKIDGNVNVAIRPRQPGSSIKVINYAYALSNGFTLATVIPDSPVTFEVEGLPSYTPKNYEGEFRGNITLRSALAESRNIPAVRVLAKNGVNNMIEQGIKMGITTWTEAKNYGLSLTLGGGEVKLLDLARAYATIANYGKRPSLASILKVSTFEGHVLGQFNCCDQPQILSPGVAFLITDILKDNEARAPSFGTNSLLVIPNHKEVAVKTGTSNDLRDNLAIGYTQNYVVAVWIGNNDNSQMDRIASGVTGATPIFNKIMTALLANKENHDWEVPPGLVQLPICPYTGTLACEGCPTKMEWFLEEKKPDATCSPEWFKEAEGPEPVEGKEENENDQITPTPTGFAIDINNQLFDKLLEEQRGKRYKKTNEDR